jgi:hypothetical protein
MVVALAPDALSQLEEQRLWTAMDVMMKGAHAAVIMAWRQAGRETHAFVEDRPWLFNADSAVSQGALPAGLRTPEEVSPDSVCGDEDSGSVIQKKKMQELAREVEMTTSS